MWVGCGMNTRTLKREWMPPGGGEAKRKGGEKTEMMMRGVELGGGRDEVHEVKGLDHELVLKKGRKEVVGKGWVGVRAEEVSSLGGLWMARGIIMTKDLTQKT